MNGILRGSSKIAVGSFAGFAVALALTPLITRSYDPATFGTFGLVVAVASSFIGFSTFRLEILALRSEDDAQFLGLARRGIALATLISACLTVCGLAFLMFGAQWVWALIGVLVLVGSLQLIGTAVFSRGRAYQSVAVGNFIQQGGMPTVQATLGFTGSIWGLLLGFVLPRMVWLRPSIRLRSADRSVTVPWVEARPAAASALLNSAGSQLPIILVGFMYGVSGSGFVALAQRIFTAPLQVVASAISATSTAEISALLRNSDRKAAHQLVLRTMRTLALVSIGPLVVAALAAPLLAGRVLGAEWENAGLIVSALALGSYAQFCAAPFAQTLNLSGHSRRLMFWDLGRAITAAASLVIAGMLGLPLPAAVLTFSVSMFIVYASLAYLVTNAMSPKTPMEGNP